MEKMMPKIAGLTWSLMLALVLGAGNVNRVFADETECASIDEEICKAEKDEQMVIYTQGRNAYETARTSGDFTEAYKLARKLALAGDKNGERLRKMVIMQLGWGAHRDYVQAYRWMSDDIADGVDYAPLWRDKLTGKMTPDQLAQAKETTAK
jgi:hypothetical protein